MIRRIEERISSRLGSFEVWGDMASGRLLKVNGIL
jgi:hypothetical protein